jgi:hypothetical protein
VWFNHVRSNHVRFNHVRFNHARFNHVRFNHVRFNHGRFNVRFNQRPLEREVAISIASLSNLRGILFIWTDPLRAALKGNRQMAYPEGQSHEIVAQSAGWLRLAKQRYDVDPSDQQTYGLLSKYQGISYLWLHQPNPARIAAQPFFPQQPTAAHVDAQCPLRLRLSQLLRLQLLRRRRSLAWRHR